jgi:nucleoside-diphosphate-sugar epimerase
MKNLQKFYEGKKVLVTGGAGFIGSHLSEKLVELGARVSVLDNFSTGKIQNLKNIVHSVNIIYSDVSLDHVCLKATQSQDLVFHCAALVSVPHSIKYPDLCKKINVQGTKNLLVGCVKNGVKVFVFSSSCAVYGDKTGPCSENDSTCPKSPYAQSKLEGESLCKKYSQDFGIKTVSLRYFNVYGERQNFNGEYSSVMAKFKYNIENGLPITIFGDGFQTRDFVKVSDVVDANLKISMSSNLNGEIFNVASGQSIKILDLVKMLEKDLGKSAPEIKFEGARLGDIKNSVADCKKYKELISCSF